MSRPNNSLAKIKVPGENVQRPIIPYAVGYEVEDEYNPGSYIPGDYIATLPILTEDSTIALKSDIPSVLETGVSNKDKYLHTNASTGALE